MRSLGLTVLVFALVCVTGYGFLGWASAACDTNCPTPGELQTYKAMFFGGAGALAVIAILGVACLFRKKPPRR